MSFEWSEICVLRIDNGILSTGADRCGQPQKLLLKRKTLRQILTQTIPPIHTDGTSVNFFVSDYPKICILPAR